jgi:hypothetical protein
VANIMKPGNHHGLVPKAGSMQVRWVQVTSISGPPQN